MISDLRGGLVHAQSSEEEGINSVLITLIKHTNKFSKHVDLGRYT